MARMGDNVLVMGRKRTTVFVSSLSDGLASLVDVAPREMTVFTEESDWAFVGGDFTDAIDTVVSEDERLQPQLPFDVDRLNREIPTRIIVKS